MAILRSVDGKFYEVPDKDLEKFEIPADQLREKLGDAAEAAPGPGGPAGPGGPGGGAGSQVVIQIHGNADGPRGGLRGNPQSGDEAEPYWGWWRNCWNNCWRNCWNNCWRNCY